MKLTLFAATLVAEIASKNFATVKLDQLEMEITDKYEYGHIHCDQNDIPNKLENGIEIIKEDLQCEVLFQHTVCSTQCKTEKRIEFECDCNRSFMTISIFDKNSCHWKRIVDAPCLQADPEPSKMLHDINISTSSLSSEDIMSMVIYH